MGHVNQTIEFGPIAGTDRNVLAPVRLSVKHDEREAIGQLANHANALAYLLVQLSAEIATLNATGNLSGQMLPIANGFSRLGQTFSAAGLVLDGWGIPDDPQPSP